ncbi:hypothetical protein EOJ36_03995 [Sandaracinomonas limnophila]|uniref:Uncharacterized protein n=1 Tax=Sandaracinomonas limnophila TaxID=1862386 RepID=A0A437PTL6_9BACT|nr:hypothetical protein [Sandaracinomonas limnophila]RVU25588.1 hypothetical protein EOJ36_03995 [Sandaracinomonas limnophila]
MIEKFVKYYSLMNHNELDVCQKTNNLNFGLIDVNKEVKISSFEKGEAKYRNEKNSEVLIFDYDRFISKQNNAFQHGKKRCDAIVFTTNKSDFIFNEIKNRHDFASASLKGIKQLNSSLETVLEVPVINRYIKRFRSKKCCFCNFTASSPQNVNATQAFGRLWVLLPQGANLPHQEINAMGFELWEYSGLQTIILGN